MKSNSKKKRLVIVSRNTRGVGGMQRYTQDLLKVCNIKKEDIEIYFVGPKNSKTKYVGMNNFREYLRAIFFMLIVSIKCVIWSKKKDVNFHFCEAIFAPIAMIVRKISPATYISVTAHGCDVTYPPKWYQYMLQKCLQYFDCIVCVSNATLNRVNLLTPQCNTIFIPNAIWTNEYSIKEKLCNKWKTSDSAPLLITVGRMMRRKGVLWFISEVMPDLIKIYPSIRYYIVGEGPDEAIIKKEVEKNGFEKNVIMFGTQTGESLSQLFSQADIFIMPNIHIDGELEGFGYVCIEASAQGIPVLAARIEGIQDAVIEDKTGFFFKSNNARDCLKQLTHLLSDPLNPKSTRKNTINSYSWEKISKQYFKDVFRIHG